MKNKIIYKAGSRGFANHGWLKSYHTFSFANYRNPERMSFGTLRVLNDDYVAAGMGFGMHRHENMEIVSIPLAGSLSHKDSLGNSAIITTGEIQVMSAGTGVEHSEFNPNSSIPSEFLQIWIFPNKLNITPRYDQKKIEVGEPNQWQQILSPQPTEKSVSIQQNTWFHLADLTLSNDLTYNLKDSKNGVFLFVLEGSILMDNDQLDRRDAIGVWNLDHLQIKATQNSRILLIETPIELPEYLK